MEVHILQCMLFRLARVALAFPALQMACEMDYSQCFLPAVEQPTVLIISRILSVQKHLKPHLCCSMFSCRQLWKKQNCHVPLLSLVLTVLASEP
uniref:Putative secreted protein n=1 Tax=Amblyomma cajennense TaxID=34607 RepID=A0A023FBU6_AMBCJ